MARFIPKLPESFHGSIGEEKAFAALRLLDNNYVVFHSFNWIGISDRIQGEADFVVIHPVKGILVIELKSGAINYQLGQWTQTNTLTGFTKTISPFVQANKSKFEIIERLNLKLRLGRTPLVCHAVWFPSFPLITTDRLPPEAPKEIILDETALSNVQTKIDAVFDYWKDKTGFSSSMNPSQLNEIIEVLAPTFRAVPGLKSIIDETEEYYIRLTNQQAAVFNYLTEQKTAAIHGLAGTGKTVLAVEKARMLAEAGSSVLYLCYNSFLRDFLRSKFSQPGISFHNVHSLASEILFGEDIKLDELLDELEQYLYDDIQPEDWAYDNIIIDEGQDLNENLVSRLSELTKAGNGCFYVFYDRNQYVMKNEMPKWVEEAECKLVLHRNCRNTVEISKTACSMIGMDGSVIEDTVHGETPTAIYYKNTSELLDAARQFVNTAIDADIKPDEIVFLTIETEKTSALADIGDINGIPISSVRKDGHILFTTVRKFKGLEAKAVMVIDISVRSLINPEKQRLVYIGCSRAKHLLKLAIYEDIRKDEYGDCLRRINSERNVPKNQKGLGRLLNVNISRK
ncbi:MAG TPA: hypothetical protein DIW17_09315 [Clostridiales bacterium]|nr:hypothetical protein [Clostridiales bacterium]